MKIIKKLIIATALLTAFAPAAYAMDQNNEAENSEEDDGTSITGLIRSMMGQHQNNVRTQLHEAAIKGDVALVQRLIDSHARIDATDTYKNTPLHLAARKPVLQQPLRQPLGYRQRRVARTHRAQLQQQVTERANRVCVVQILIDHNADINATNTNGDTAAIVAANTNNHTALNILLLHGAIVDSKLQKIIDEKADHQTRHAYKKAIEKREKLALQRATMLVTSSEILTNLPTPLRKIINDYDISMWLHIQQQKAAAEKAASARQNDEQEDDDLVSPENRQQSLAEAQQAQADTREQESIALSIALNADEATQVLEATLNSESEGKESEEFTEQELRAYEQALRQRDRNADAAAIGDAAGESSASDQSETTSVSTEQWEHLTMQQKRDKLSKAAARRSV